MSAVDTKWKDTPTRTISAGGGQFAYRELGPRGGVPLVFLHHLGADLDDLDSLVAAFDVVAEFAREGGDAAHEGTGDAEDVDFHCVASCGLQPTSLTGAIASMMRVNTSSSEPTPSTTVSWPCWR